MEKAVKKTNKLVDFILKRVPEPPKHPPDKDPGFKKNPEGKFPEEPRFPDRKVPPVSPGRGSNSDKKPAPGFPDRKVPDVPGKGNSEDKKPDPKYPDRKVPPKSKPSWAKKDNDKALYFTKEGERMRWICDFTNNFRDRDYPPEILASVAHERFVKEVDDGEYPMPELWWWHMDGTRVGQADWLGYDKEAGINMASGFVDKGKEALAERILAYPEPLGVSHGMIIPLLERDTKDKSTITRYVSREISALPARVAANPLTEITIGKEINMAITEEKKQSLKTLGYSEEQISEVEARNAMKAADAKDAGVESKEAEAPVAEAVAEAVAETPKAEVAEVVPPVEEPLTRKEVADAIVMAVTKATEPLIKMVNEQGQLLANMDKKAKEDAKKELSGTPSAALGAMIARSFSAIGNPAAAVDGRSSLVKSGPVAPVAEEGHLPPFLRDFVK